MDKKLALSLRQYGCKAILGGLIASGQVQPGPSGSTPRRRTRLQLCATSMASTPPTAPEKWRRLPIIVFGAVKPGIMTKCWAISPPA